MKLEDKRKVIVILLCAGSVGAEPIEYVAESLGFSDLSSEASELWWDFAPSPYQPGGMYDAGALDRQYELDATEAAYRLIESSPTLRREWFGAA